MGPIPFFLPLATFLLLSLHLLGRANDCPADVKVQWRKAFLLAAIFWGSFVALSSEILGLFSLINRSSLVVAWALRLVTILSYAWSRGSVNRGYRQLRKLRLPAGLTTSGVAIACFIALMNAGAWVRNFHTYGGAYGTNDWMDSKLAPTRLIERSKTDDSSSSGTDQNLTADPDAFEFSKKLAQSAGQVQSVIVGSALGIVAFLMFLRCLLSVLTARNRRLAEEILYGLRLDQVGARRSELVVGEPKVKCKLPRAFGPEFLTSSP